jgi:aminomethyltransferase
VLAEGKAVGVVTSGTFAPTLGRSLAMALVDPAVATVGTSLTVDVRGHAEPAHVTAIPFYRKVS